MFKNIIMNKDITHCRECLKPCETRICNNCRWQRESDAITWRDMLEKHEKTFFLKRIKNA